MLETLSKIFILSLVSIAICVPFWDDMIFEKQADAFKKWLGKKLKPRHSKTTQEATGEFWAKPLFGCHVCATFWYSIVQCLIYGWPVYLCIPAMGVSAVISQISKE